MAKRKRTEIPRERLREQERLIVKVTEAIARQMLTSGVRKSDLAERLGTSKAYITQALAGGQNLTLRTLADLAWALRCQADLELAPADAEVDRQDHVFVRWLTYDRVAHALSMDLDTHPSVDETLQFWVTSAIAPIHDHEAEKRVVAEEPVSELLQALAG